jgi:hypothetical protein
MTERDIAVKTVPDPRARAVLDTLIRAKGLKRWAYFFTTGEGCFFPDGTEECSGNVIDEYGRVFFFWTDWDAEHNTPMMRIWEQEEPESRWAASAEYRRARRAVGLPPPA